MLRPYQTKAIEAIVDAYKQGVRRQMVSMATGTGKTQVFANLPSVLHNLIPGKILVLAHRTELIDQAIEKIRSANPALIVSKEMASEVADTHADVIVASVASLGRKETKRAKTFDWSAISVVITDECHHATATTYGNIYEQIGILAPNSSKLHIGFTATAQRGDGVPLAHIYQRIVYTYDLRRAIEDGWLVDVRGLKVSTNTSLDHVHTIGGDFDGKELATTINTPERNRQILKTYLEYGDERKTLGFAVDVKHAQNLAELFQQAGLKAEAVWGDDPERQQKRERLRTGETQIAFCCELWTEGFDEPSISCVLMARPSKSSVFFTQCVGRATRLYEGKTDCLIIDFVDLTKRHSLVTLPTLMGMAARLNLQGHSLLGSVRRLEAAQAEYQHLDFSNLDDIDNLEAHIEAIDLFKVKFSPDVENNSDFSWHNSATGGYVLMLPTPEKDERNEIRITQNMLDKWEIKAYIKGKRYKGERDTVEAVFQAADKLVQDICPDALQLVKREATWHELSPTPAQLNLIAKFFRGKPIPKDLTRGQASALIGSALAKKA